MSTTSIDIRPKNDYSIAEKKATTAFLDALSKLNRSFWAYTEETGESNTKPFDGIL
ncbi:MAG: hypothetical protein GKR97_02780 [Rhizobiaceae bacterium]|nr:hypothetical protein [Rhizobiaceae bacterium]